MLRWLSRLVNRGTVEPWVVPVPYIDVHAHVLPGVDDGPATMDDAVALVRQAAALGVTHIIAAAHAGERYGTGSAAVSSAMTALAAALAAAKVPVTLVLGREVMFTDELLVRVPREAGLRIAGGQYALLELPEGLNQTTASEGFALLKAAGVRPILAHPERTWLVQHRPELANKFRLHGVLVQVNASSIAGAWGSSTRRTAWRLLEDDAVDLLASDAHGPRDYDLFDSACSRVAHAFEPERLRRLIRDVPALVAGLTLDGVQRQPC